MAGRKIKEPQRISIENDSLKDARICFDTVVDSILNAMNKKNIKEGDVTMKLNIKFMEGTKETIRGEEKIMMPFFDFKVTGSYKEKSELSGEAGGAEYELIQMDGGWGIRSFNNGQMELDI